VPTSISIITATYNDAANLERTLASIRSQRRPPSLDVEVIVSDGASTDRTPQIVADFGDTVTVFSSREDSGVYHAMNLGAAAARGDWIHFLNAGDTFTTAEALTQWQTAVEHAVAEPIWVVSRARNLRAGAAPAVVIPNLPHRWWRHALGLQPHCHQATWVKSDAFTLLGGLRADIGIAGDFDFILRLGLLAPPLEIDEVLIDYLGGGISEQRRSSIPDLQHRVRTERFNLTPLASRADVAVQRGVSIVNLARIRGGAFRKSWTHRP
jgi:glycosyltransferase involved in cell wall biosynthesis